VGGAVAQIGLLKWVGLHFSSYMVASYQACQIRNGPGQNCNIPICTDSGVMIPDKRVTFV